MYYRILKPEFNYIVLGRFFRGPDDDYKESKHVALR